MSQVLTGPLTQKIKDTNLQKKVNMEDKKNMCLVSDHCTKRVLTCQNPRPGPFPLVSAPA